MYTKAVAFGNHLELYEYEYTPRPKRQGIKTKRTYSDVQSLTKSFSKRYDSIKRVRKNFYRLVLANLDGKENPCFLSLTTVNERSIQFGYRYFTEFIQRLRKKYGKGFRYIAVPEFQKRGAIHFHVIIWGLHDDVVFHEAPWSFWSTKASSLSLSRFLKWCNEKGYKPEHARGNRDLQHKWGRGFLDCLPTDGDYRIAGYMAKYMQKAMSDKRLFGQKGYVRSRNTLSPVSLTANQYSYWLEAGGDSQEAVDKCLVIQKDFMTQWLGKGRYKLFRR